MTIFSRHLRDLADKLRRTSGGRIAVIGGGFLGSELSVSLLKQPKSTDSKNDDSDSKTQSKLSIMHAFRETVPMGSVLPPCLASAVGRFESSKGIELWSSSDVVSLSLIPNTNVNTSTHATTTTTTTTSVKESQKLLPLENVISSTNTERVRLRIRRTISGIERVEEVDVDHVVCAVSFFVFIIQYNL